MNIIIPLGGTGERFKKYGYKKPKPLINVLGKPILFWLLDNLNLANITQIIIPYNSQLEQYNFESLLEKNYPKIDFKFLKLVNQTQGAAESVLKGIDAFIVDDSPIICLDGDNFYACNIIKMWGGKTACFYFDDHSDSTSYSFLEINKENYISNIIEKNRITPHACTGAYGFTSALQLKKYCKYIVEKNIKQNNEFYMSGVIKAMIDDNIKINAIPIDNEHYICLGTPFNVRLFCNNYPRVSAIDGNIKMAPQRYCFDLDNTLVTYPIIAGDYTTVRPIMTNIDFLKYLKKMGHTIIIYTARRMNSHHGNIGKVLADIGKITFNTLEKFNIPYDEIYFGKPYADYYIDDLAVSPYDDLEKELGFYKSIVDTRSYNTINSGTICTYKKSGIDLSGEIYWYRNIPSAIKDMFPLFIDHDIDNKWYLMERINGIPFSKLMLAGDMTIENLKHIMNSIERIHNTNIQDTSDINIYENYCKKIEERYAKYDYFKFKNSHSIYNFIHEKLDEYEKNNLGQKSIIHGDTVLTNIMINQFGKIKLIDMRGKVGNTLTIFGDKFYDWAKLYQSLVGYEEIMEEKYLSVSYKDGLLQYFRERFVTSFGNKNWEYLQYITASLLFTLIPLHDNEKCFGYYGLIFKLLNI